MTGQSIIILLVILAAIAYLARRAWHKFRKLSCNCGCSSTDNNKNTRVSRVLLTVNSHRSR